MEQYLTCSNCRCEIDEHDHQPIVVNCQHLICKKCVLAGDPQNQEINCESCKERVSFSKEKMTVNVVVLNLLRTVKKYLVCHLH